MSKVVGARHRLKTEGVIIHVHWGEDDGVGIVVRCSLGSWLDGVKKL